MFKPSTSSESSKNLEASCTDINLGLSIDGMPSGGGPPLTI
jgi:hypothetical protein